jgi:Reeler domain
MWIKEILIFYIQLRLAFSLSAGAPDLACNNLTPQHGTTVPQTSPFPASVEVPIGIESGSTVQVRIFGINPDFVFRGFMIQAKPLDNVGTLGIFRPVDANAQQLNCFSQVGSTATHTSSTVKSEVVLEWEAPIVTTPIPFNFVLVASTDILSFIYDFLFFHFPSVTVLASFDTFWVLERFGLNVIAPEPTTTEDPEPTDPEETDPPPGVPTPPPPTPQPTDLTPLVMTHGSMMIVAWIGCTSIGVVIAAYFKNVWHRRKSSSTEVWFIWHVLCMFLTWTLTLSAFIIIFIEIGEWRTSVHSILGCIVMLLATIQPLGGLLRYDCLINNITSIINNSYITFLFFSVQMQGLVHVHYLIGYTWHSEILLIFLQYSQSFTRYL